MSRTQLLFLYGSLLEGTGHQQVDRIISRFTRVLYQGYVQGQLFDLGDYPALVTSDRPGNRVFGAVVELSRASFNLHLLDRFEDYRPNDESNSLYLRRRIMVTCLPLKREVEAWCYVYNRPVRPDMLIRSGQWLAHRQRQEQ
ncbi:MAG: gamma-glutamylcyclotransferase [Granulosicoccaceae bacterium]|jgi:gamma-glutamylcyclotransferase (GGCT)/AIG2-like uncharacterized protein YtfP